MDNVEAISIETILGAGSWMFVGGVLVVALWETFQPKVTLGLPTARRWGIHFFLSLATPAINHVLPAIGAVLLAVQVRSHENGVLNHEVIPFWVQAVSTVLALDLVPYGRHRMNHAIPVGWRLHLLHHSDHDFDFSNAFRFHPLEVILTLTVQALAVVILAPPPSALAVTLILFGLNSLYAHANVRIPEKAERLLRLVLITPALHRIHHLQAMRGQQSNFGDLFSFWDRMFGTFLEESEEITADGPVGVLEVGAERSGSLRHIAGAPFGL